MDEESTIPLALAPLVDTSNNGTISNNNVIVSKNGIRILEGSNNTITNNNLTATSRSGDGMVLSSSSNKTQ